MAKSASARTKAPPKTKPGLASNPAAFTPCTLRILPEDKWEVAARDAVDQNPANRSARDALPDMEFTPLHLALLTGKYWGASGVKLTVGFMESTPSDLAARILSHMNAWGPPTANVSFALSSTDPDVRITRSGGGYWSYLGIDIRHIPRGEPTMSLQGFTMRTRESEFLRVVRHETGHTLGFPHEHMRPELVEMLDVQKTIDYFQRTQGWSASEVRAQVLTPLSRASIRGSPGADDTSIMCYQLPGSITKSGRPIPGGADINAIDRAFIATVYPPVERPVPPPPPSEKTRTLVIVGATRITLDGKEV